MGTTENLVYENFIRYAFGKAYDTSVERWGDPASLANTDVFDVDSISKVKAGVSYSMAILNHILYEEHLEQLRDRELITRIDTMLDEVINATDKITIYNLIEEYKEKCFPIMNS